MLASGLHSFQECRQCSCQDYRWHLLYFSKSGAFIADIWVAFFKESASNIVRVTGLNFPGAKRAKGGDDLPAGSGLYTHHQLLNEYNSGQLGPNDRLLRKALLAR